MEVPIIFEIRDAERGGIRPPALGHAIFTTVKTCDVPAKGVEAASLPADDNLLDPRFPL
jgi:hypothetical protein